MNLHLSIESRGVSRLLDILSLWIWKKWSQVVKLEHAPGRPITPRGSKLLASTVQSGTTASLVKFDTHKLLHEKGVPSILKFHFT